MPMGRPKKLNDEQILEVLDLWDNTRLSTTEIGERFGVSRWAIRRLIKEYRPND